MMTPRDVEKVYDALARELDAIDASKRELYLAKLALLLATDLDDAPRACDLITEANQNLDG